MRLIALLLIPALVMAQTDQLSEAAKKLLRRPKSGSAQVTWVDRRKENGRIVRVTDRIVTFKPSGAKWCKDVELSNIAKVRWYDQSAGGYHDPVEFGIVFLVYYGLIFGPPYAVYRAVELFKTPPLHPPSGEWRSTQSGLQFGLGTVQGIFRTVKRGRYFVTGDKLHMTSSGEPETVVSFHFDCEHLVLDDLDGEFNPLPSRRTVVPIVGAWRSGGSSLEFAEDGAFEERDEQVRHGVFTASSTGVKIHWLDSEGPGGQDWIAKIDGRRLVIRVGPVITKYHFIP